MGFDVFGISEVNMYWKKVEQELQFMERVKKWWNPRETRATFSYNSKGYSTLNSTRQSGGTAQISRGNAALKYQSSGEDPRGLGRWTWQLYRGKDNRTLRIITAYRPIKAKAKGGIYTVWAQHRRYFNSIAKKDAAPTQIILDDLAIEIRRWKRAGDNIVLMMDCNESVSSPAIKDFLLKTDMIEAISDRHGGTPPRTYIEGSKQIDGIFITRSIAVTAGGFTAFNDGVQGERPDHRCLWIDVKMESVLGHQMPGATKFAGRRVKTQDARVVDKFNEAYKNFAIRHGLAKKIFTLEKYAVYPLPPHLQILAAQITELRYEGLKYADRKCRKLFLGKVPYTPEYKKLINGLKFWKFAIRKKEGRKIDSRQLQRLLKKAKIQTRLKDIMNSDIKTMKNQSKETNRAYRKYLKKADVARERWLEDLAQARAEKEARIKAKQQEQQSHRKKGQPTSAKEATAAVLKRLQTQENSRRLFGRITTAIGKENLAGISLITVPDGKDPQGNVQWKEVSSHREIVNALIDNHKEKYHQTEGTPPMTGTIKSQIGYLGIGEEADKILDGQYVQRPGTDQYSALLLNHLKRVDPSLPELPVGISGQEYSDGWRKAKEQTSAGGSILHFGHCKAIAQDAQLSDMEAAFLSIPLRSGYAFKQWRKGIDCVLPKKANSFRVDKLRTIVLLEADFNFTNKFVSRKTARRAEKTGGFAKEQFGSRKRHRAIDHAWNKQLTLDLLRQLRTPGVLAPNDLKSCYDRICHSIASLCMRRQGVAESEAVCMFATLQHLEHTIRCAYGDSDETYGKEVWAIPMQGVYQGNGAGPVVWAVVSSPVLQIMREAGFGTFFKTSISGEDIRFVGYAFVDDTDLIQTAKTANDNIHSVIAEMQKGMDMWEGLIRATGGALSVIKCCWWAIDFKWFQDGTWKYKSKNEIEGHLYARDFDGDRKQISRLEINKAFETLGVFIAPDGNQKDQIAKLTDKVTTWAERLRTAHLREQETAVALKATILKTLEYPLLTLHLSEDQCKKLMKPILHAALPKSKFNRNFCRRTLYGPGGHLGVEIHNLFTSQLIEHVDGILRHGPAPTLSGQLLRSSIEAVKVEIGLQGDLFGHSFKQYGHLATDCWVTRTWQELELAEIKVTERTSNVVPLRERDVLIMERLSACGFKGIALRRLNRCRLRLQVMSLADLCNGQGSHVLSEFLDGHNPMIGRSAYSWPRQGNLNDMMWRTWKRALKKVFRFNRAGELPIPLGRWLTTTNDPNWTAWHSPSEFRTYIRDGDIWCQFQHQPRNFDGQADPVEVDNCSAVPTNVLKAVAWIREGELCYHGYSRNRNNTVIQHTSLGSFFNTLEMEYKWIAPWIQMPDDARQLADDIRKGTAMAVADGSFKNARGTSAFCISNQDGGNKFCGCNDVPSDWDDDQCSYRSELAGILGLLLFCKALCSIHNIKQGRLTIGCDNIEAGRHAIDYSDNPRPTDNHFDILAVIHRIKATIPLQLSYKHVEGHQREKYPGRPLDVWAKLNDQMDALAKAYWVSIDDSPKISNHTLMPSEWKATVEGKRICTNFKLALRRQLEGRQLENRWQLPTKQGKGRLKPPLFTHAQIIQLDTYNIQRAWNRAPGNRRRFASKLSTSFFPVGRYMKRMKFWPTSKCPCCKRPNESVQHMLALCQDNRVLLHRRNALLDFEKHLRNIKTDSQIRKALLSLLNQILFQQTRRPEDEPCHLRSAIASQLHIGLPHLLLGRISCQWAPLQHKAYTHYAPWLHGNSWAQKVVTGIWELTFTIWEHRNHIFHHNEVMDEMLDMDSIDLQILEEYHAGYTGIPSLDYHLFRGLSLDELLAKRGTYRREWLASVRMARAPGDSDLEDASILQEPQIDTPNNSLNPNPTLPQHDGAEASDSTTPDSSSSDSSSDE